MSGHERLYGLPHAEVMYVTPAEVYETDIDGWHDPDDGPVTIEEWTKESTAMVAQRFPQTEHIIEWVVDSFLDEYGAETDQVGVEGGFLDREARTLTQALVDHLASMVRWRWADEKVAEHTVTWDANGEPLLDGEPMYRKTADRDGGQ